MSLFPAPAPPREPSTGAETWNYTRAKKAVRSAMESLATGVFTVGGAAGGLAAAVVDVGAAAPVVGPVFTALSLAKGMVDQMGDGREEIARLHDQCTDITTRIIVRCNKDSTHGIDVTPLTEVVDDIRKFAKYYNGRGVFSRMRKMKNNNGRIEALRRRIGEVVARTNLEVSVRNAENMTEEFEMLRKDLASLRRSAQPNGTHVEPARERAKLASVPNGKPAGKAWHVVRELLVQEIYEGFALGDGPGLVGLVGRSGSGKTTCAAAVVGVPSLANLPRAEEHDQALDALNCVRAHFCDGVVWLRVGKGAGSPHRLPEIMKKLASEVHSEILGHSGSGPGASPQKNPLGGSAYIREALRKCKDGRRTRCLVVADDVWESQVLEELKHTGMSVLVTTRNENLIRLAEGKVVEVDGLTPKEAESVLRRAAELPAGALLPAGAAGILERCDNMAMHLEFVGRCTDVRGSEHSSDWEKAAKAIAAEFEEVQRDNADRPAGEIDPFENRRVAILRAGFKNLAALNPHSQSLYLALTVLPDGHAFAPKEAAVLLLEDWDTDASVDKAAKAVGDLERWAVVTMEGSLYRMHDAHVRFAKSRLVEREHVEVVGRWRAHISSLDALAHVDNQTLRELWGALESAGGESWHDDDPYRPALDELGDADDLCFESLVALVSLYYSESEWASIHPVATRLLEIQDARRDAEVVKHALVMLIHSANRTDRQEDAEKYRRDLSDMLGTREEFERNRPADQQNVIRALAVRGQRLDMANRCQEARTTLEDALGMQGNYESIGKLELARMMKDRARVLRHLDLKEEAAEAYQQTLAAMEEVLGHNELGLATTLHDLGTALLALDKYEEAADVFRRCWSISEERGLDNRSVAGTIHSLASCLEELSLHEEAASLRERARMGAPIRRSSSRLSR